MSRRYGSVSHWSLIVSPALLLSVCYGCSCASHWLLNTRATDADSGRALSNAMIQVRSIDGRNDAQPWPRGVSRTDSEGTFEIRLPGDAVGCGSLFFGRPSSIPATPPPKEIELIIHTIDDRVGHMVVPMPDAPQDSEGNWLSNRIDVDDLGFTLMPRAGDATLSTDFEPGVIVAADLTGDDTDELIVFNELSMSLNIFDDLEKNRITLDQPFEEWVGAMAVADLDADFDNDLVLGGSSLEFWRNDGTGRLAFWKSRNIGLLHIDRIEFSSLDEDDHIDLIVGGGVSFTRHLLVFLKGPEGPDPRRYDTTGTLAGSADTDGDGYIDIVIIDADADEIIVHLNNGNGDLSDMTAQPVPFDLSFQGGITLDLDNDGDPDVVSIVFGGLVTAFNDSKGHFSAGGLIALKGSDVELHSADIDADGDADLAVALYDKNEVVVLLNDGAGGFSQRHTHSTGHGPGAMVVSHLDPNGCLDIATANRWDSTVSLLFDVAFDGVCTR